MSDITLQNIRCHGLNGLSLHVREKELFVLVGPSGAGKTTLLNVVAGLMPHEGHILVDAVLMDGLPPHRRQIGYLFQDLLLFPHMSVKRNLRTALSKRRMSGTEKDHRISDMVDLFRLRGLEDKRPDQLSGGEKQRVALARAIVSAPKVLLLDEPFSSLDFRTARYLRLELKRIHARLKTTMLFVTHDLEEARELADRMGVMMDGRLEQVGGIEELMFQGKPGHSDFLEKPNIFSCTYLKRLGNGLVHVQWANQDLFIPEDGGKPFSRVFIHPRDIYISPYPPPGPPVNRFYGRITDMRHAAGMAHVDVAVMDHHVHAEMTAEQARSLSLSEGDSVYGILKLRALHGC